ncbi:MAG TPA: BON domain-containing protein [Ramlibacter sp.]|nr:BON domain-containing protein [Ramlibacter sp.]
MTFPFRRPLLALLTTALAAGALGGCAPLLLGGAAVGTMMVYDRRTSGAQVEDEGIELRAASRLRDAFGQRAHINASSYNRQVLLTGEVASEADKAQAEQVVARVENVRLIVNELAVMASTTLAQRSGDALVTGKVKASLLDARDLYAGAIKVVTERGITYMMGRVTAREADRATQIARSVNGVQRVVRIFEIVSDQELQQMVPAAQRPVPLATPPQPAPVSTPAAVAPGAPQPATVAPAAVAPVEPAQPGAVATPVSPPGNVVPRAQ